MVAYARILPGDPSAGNRPPSPLDDMVHNGILAVTGDFTRNTGFADFMRNELNTSMQEGLGGLLDRMKDADGNLPEGIDQESLKEKLGEFSNMEIIPVPAKVVQYESESDILAEDADVFYLGEFMGQSQAHLCITSFPIYYQARYREQTTRIMQNEISSLLSEVERTSLVSEMPNAGLDPAILHLQGDLTSFQGHLLELLTGQIIPNLVYNTGNPIEFQQSMDRFKLFMRPYRYPTDITAIENILEAMRLGHSAAHDRRKLELLCQKVSALHHEEFERLQAIQNELAQLYNTKS
jgi:hypothetical protein